MAVGSEILAKYQMTIGIECHVQLATASKLFSSAGNDARMAEPNSLVSPVDYALPGMLPVLNQRAVELAIRAGLALQAPIAEYSSFDRKHYFYPDLPSGYQITQMYHPTILAGLVEAPLADGGQVKVRVHHAHIEMDAGKLTHYANYSLVDLNRAGTPLIEIVSEPDMHSPAEARAYATELHHLMTYAGVTLGDLYHGNMRFDVNLSVAPIGSETLGIRTETKNLNSFRSIERAAQFEFERQVELLERGQKITQETRGWLDDEGRGVSQRTKEDAQDYRYMPDPDIPPIRLSSDYVTKVQAEVPMLPGRFRAKLRLAGLDHSLTETAIAIDDQAVRDFLVEVIDQTDAKLAKRILNWLIIDVQGRVSAGDYSWQGAKLYKLSLEELARMVESSEVSSNSAVTILYKLLEAQSDPRQLAESMNLLQVSDEAAIAVVVAEVLDDPASQQSLADIRAGKDKAIGYLVGQVMKRSSGQANPGLAQKLIRAQIKKEE